MKPAPPVTSAFAMRPSVVRCRATPSLHWPTDGRHGPPAPGGCSGRHVLLDRARVPRHDRRGPRLLDRGARPLHAGHRVSRVLPDAPRPHHRGGADQVRLSLHHARGLGPAPPPLPPDVRLQGGRRPDGGRRARRSGPGLRHGLPPHRAEDAVAALGAPPARTVAGGDGRRAADVARPLRPAGRLPRVLDGGSARGDRNWLALRSHLDDRRDRGRAGDRVGGDRSCRSRRLPSLPPRRRPDARRRRARDPALRRTVQRRDRRRLAAHDAHPDAARHRLDRAAGRVLPRRAVAAGGLQRRVGADTARTADRADARLGAW